MSDFKTSGEFWDHWQHLHDTRAERRAARERAAALEALTKKPETTFRPLPIGQPSSVTALSLEPPPRSRHGRRDVDRLLVELGLRRR